MEEEPEGSGSDRSESPIEDDAAPGSDESDSRAGSVASGAVSEARSGSAAGSNASSPARPESPSSVVSNHSRPDSPASDVSNQSRPDSPASIASHQSRPGTPESNASNQSRPGSPPNNSESEQRPESTTSHANDGSRPGSACRESRPHSAASNQGSESEIQSPSSHAPSGGTRAESAFSNAASEVASEARAESRFSGGASGDEAESNDEQINSRPASVAGSEARAESRVSGGVSGDEPESNDEQINPLPASVAGSVASNESRPQSPASGAGSEIGAESPGSHMNHASPTNNAGSYAGSEHRPPSQASNAPSGSGSRPPSRASNEPSRSGSRPPSHASNAPSNNGSRPPSQASNAPSSSSSRPPSVASGMGSVARSGSRASKSRPASRASLVGSNHGSGSPRSVRVESRMSDAPSERAGSVAWSSGASHHGVESRGDSRVSHVDSEALSHVSDTRASTPADADRSLHDVPMMGDQTPAIKFGPLSPRVVLGNLFDGLVASKNQESSNGLIASGNLNSIGPNNMPPLVVVERGGRLVVWLMVNPKSQLSETQIANAQDVLSRNLKRERSFVVRQATVMSTVDVHHKRSKSTSTTSTKERKKLGKEHKSSVSAKRVKRVNSNESMGRIAVSSSKSASQFKSKEIISSSDSDSDVPTSKKTKKSESAISQLPKRLDSDHSSMINRVAGSTHKRKPIYSSDDSDHESTRRPSRPPKKKHNVTSKKSTTTASGHSKHVNKKKKRVDTSDSEADHRLAPPKSSSSSAVPGVIALRPIGRHSSPSSADERPVRSEKSKLFDSSDDSDGEVGKKASMVWQPALADISDGGSDGTRTPTKKVKPSALDSQPPTKKKKQLHHHHTKKAIDSFDVVKQSGDGQSRDGATSRSHDPVADRQSSPSDDDTSTRRDLPKDGVRVEVDTTAAAPDRPDSSMKVAAAEVGTSRRSSTASVSQKQSQTDAKEIVEMPIKNKIEGRVNGEVENETTKDNVKKVATVKKEVTKTESSLTKLKEKNHKRHRHRDESISSSRDRNHKGSDREEDEGGGKSKSKSSKENKHTKSSSKSRTGGAETPNDEPNRKKKKKSSHHHRHHNRHSDRSSPLRSFIEVTSKVGSQAELDHSGAKALWKNIQIKISQADAEATARFRKEERARRRAARLARNGGMDGGDDDEDDDDGNDKLGMTCLAVVSRLEPAVIEQWTTRRPGKSSSSPSKGRSKSPPRRTSRDKKPKKVLSRIRVISDDSSSDAPPVPDVAKSSDSKNKQANRLSSGGGQKKLHDSAKDKKSQLPPTSKKQGEGSMVKAGKNKNRVSSPSESSSKKDQCKNDRSNDRSKDRSSKKKGQEVSKPAKLKWPTTASTSVGAAHSSFDVSPTKDSPTAKRADSRVPSIDSLPLQGFEDGSLLSEEDGSFRLIDSDEVLLHARRVGPQVEGGSVCGEDECDHHSPTASELLFDPLGESAGWEDLKAGDLVGDGSAEEEDRVSGTSGVSGELFDMEDTLRSNPFRCGFSLDGKTDEERGGGRRSHNYFSTIEELGEYGDYLDDCDFHGKDHDVVVALESATPIKNSPHIMGEGSLDSSMDCRSHSPRSALVVPFAQVNDTSLTSNDGWDEAGDNDRSNDSAYPSGEQQGSQRGPHTPPLSPGEWERRRRHSPSAESRSHLSRWERMDDSGGRPSSPRCRNSWGRSPSPPKTPLPPVDCSRMARTLEFISSPTIEPDTEENVLGSRQWDTTMTGDAATAEYRFCGLERLSRRACKSVCQDTLCVFAPSVNVDAVLSMIIIEGALRAQPVVAKPDPQKENKILETLTPSLLGDDIVRIPPTDFAVAGGAEAPAFQVLANQTFLPGANTNLHASLMSVLREGLEKDKAEERVRPPKTEDKVDAVVPAPPSAANDESNDPIEALRIVPSIRKLSLAQLMIRFETEVRHSHLVNCVAIYHRLSTMIAGEIRLDLLENMLNVAKEMNDIDQVIGNYLLQTVVANIPFSANIPKQASLMIKTLSIAKKCEENPVFNHKNPNKLSLEAWSLNAIYNCVLLEALNRDMAEVVHLFRFGLEVGLLLSGELVRGLLQAFHTQGMKDWAMEAYRIGLSTGVYPKVQVRDWPSVLIIKSYYTESEMTTILSDFLPKYAKYARSPGFASEKRRPEKFTIYVNIEVMEDCDAKRVNSLCDIDWTLMGATTRMASSCAACHLEFFAREDMPIRKIGHDSVIQYLAQNTADDSAVEYPRFEEHDFKRPPSMHIFRRNVFQCLPPPPPPPPPPPAPR